MIKRKRRYKVKWKNVFKLLVFILIFASSFCIFSTIINYYTDYKNTKSILSTIDEKSKITNVVDNDHTTIIAPSDNISKFDSYWNYIKMSFIKTDMAPLKKINTHSIGWLQLKGTEINYPIVQYTNNKYYQNHSFDKSINMNGWIYLDYQNSIEELDSNTVIYGNYSYLNMLFGNLKFPLKKQWQKDNKIRI